MITFRTSYKQIVLFSPCAFHYSPSMAPELVSLHFGRATPVYRIHNVYHNISQYITTYKK